MVQLFGRITKDATVTELKDEKKVVNFSIALNDSYKPKGGEAIKQVTYINCAYWVRAESAAYLTKGKLIEVNGRLSVRAYVNLSGEAVGSINFHVNNFKLHGGGSAVLNTAPDDQPAKDTTPRRKRSGKTGGAVDASQITEPQDDLPF